MKTRKGFTLIEILIVVAIIAVLASSVLVGFGPAQRQGRDARRMADLRQVQNALELYYSKCGYYPGGAQAGSTCTAFAAAADWTALTASLTGSNIGVNSVPKDPSSPNKTYLYGSTTGSSYVLTADFEDVNNPALQNSPEGTSNGINCSRTTTPGRYCIQF